MATEHEVITRDSLYPSEFKDRMQTVMQMTTTDVNAWGNTGGSKQFKRSPKKKGKLPGDRRTIELPQSSKRQLSPSNGREKRNFDLGSGPEKGLSPQQDEVQLGWEIEQKSN